MLAKVLLPCSTILRFKEAVVEDGVIIVTASSQRPDAVCPKCHQPSTRIHSRYWRTVADLPCAERRARLHLQVRRFFCDDAICKRKTFAERLPGIVDPYPLTLALERFHTPKKQKHSTLIVYRDDGQHFTLPAWFNFYNGRQTIEAGIKETNVVFKMHPLKMRSRGGIALQEQFVLFVANFIRFARVWLRERVSCSNRNFDDALARVKDLVRVGTNTSAWVVGQHADLLVKFDNTGAYPGVELRLAGSWRTRPPNRPHRKVRKFDFRNNSVSGCT